MILWQRKVGNYNHNILILAYFCSHKKVQSSNQHLSHTQCTLMYTVRYNGKMKDVNRFYMYMKSMAHDLPLWAYPTIDLHLIKFLEESEKELYCIPYI